MKTDELYNTCIEYHSQEEALKILEVIKKYHPKVRWYNTECDVVDKKYDYTIYSFHFFQIKDDYDRDYPCLFTSSEQIGRLITIKDLINRKYDKLLEDYNL